MNDTGSVWLVFDPELNKLGKGKELRYGLSVAAQVGDTLWVTNDETISLERLTGSKDVLDVTYLYSDHTQFALNDYLQLPVPPLSDPEEIVEADLEGLDYKDGYLWLVGSHSLTRKKADKKSVEKNFERLAEVKREGNRYLLARIPLVEQNGTVTLAKEADHNGKKLTAAQLPGNDQGNELTQALAQDPHLQSFLQIPSKENGFDIEGLAVGENQRLFVGLRGPVLRGWAVILELQAETNEANPAELGLKAINPNNPYNPEYPTYRKHFLDLGGLGIRDLCVHGSDLLILAGPTMALDGPVAIFRWRGGARPEGESVVSGEALSPDVVNVPYGRGKDHAEGLTLFSPDGHEPDTVLVVYDAVSKERQMGDSATKADVFPLPG